MEIDTPVGDGSVVPERVSVAMAEIAGRVGRRGKYPEDFRQRAAQLVLDSRRSVQEVTGELEINHETLRNWVAAERAREPMGPPHAVPMSGRSWPGCGARSPSWSSSGRT